MPFGGVAPGAGAGFSFLCMYLNKTFVLAVAVRHDNSRFWGMPIWFWILMLLLLLLLLCCLLALCLWLCCGVGLMFLEHLRTREKQTFLCIYQDSAYRFKIYFSAKEKEVGNCFTTSNKTPAPGSCSDCISNRCSRFGNHRTKKLELIVL